MLTGETLKLARSTAAELRRRGEDERAAAIETLIEAAGTPEPPPPPGGEQAIDLVGVGGASLRRWVREGEHTAYRVGSVPVPADIIAAYVRRASDSLDLEPLADEEAADLVAEGRIRR